MGARFFEESVRFDEAAVQKYLSGPEMGAHLHALASRFAEAQPFDQQNTELLLRSVAEERGVKPAALIHATRVAITGRSVSPGLYEVLELLGQGACMFAAHPGIIVGERVRTYTVCAGTVSAHTTAEPDL